MVRVVPRVSSVLPVVCFLDMFVTLHGAVEKHEHLVRWFDYGGHETANVFEQIQPQYASSRELLRTARNKERKHGDLVKHTANRRTTSSSKADETNRRTISSDKTDESCFPKDAGAAVNALSECAKAYLTDISISKPESSSASHKSLSKPQSLPGPLFIQHSTKFPHRKTRLMKILADNGIRDNAIWLEQFALRSVTDEMKNCLGPMGFAPHAPAVTWASYALYKHIVEHNLEVAFVLEDDPNFATNSDERQFVQNLQKMWHDAASSKLNANATSFKMDAGKFSIADVFDVIFFGGCQEIKGLRHVGGPFFQRPFARCSTGYAISQNGARKMLAVLRRDQPVTSTIGPIPWPIDWMFEKIGQQDDCCITPGCKQLETFLLEPPLFDNGKHSENYSIQNIGLLHASDGHQI